MTNVARNIGLECFLDGCLGKSSVCALSQLFPWLVLGEEMEVVRSHPNRDHLTSRTRCVWGNTVVPELPSPPQRARPFHSHSIQTQASPFHLSRGDIRAITLVFWVGHLFQPFFIIVWCMDCLFCRSPWSHPVVLSLAQEAILTHFTATGFLIHSSCTCLDSWTFEIHWTWSEFHWFDGSISGVFSSGRRGVLGDFPGLCKILHETTLLGCPSCIPVFSLLL